LGRGANLTQFAAIDFTLKLPTAHISIVNFAQPAARQQLNNNTNFADLKRQLNRN